MKMVKVYKGRRDNFCELMKSNFGNQVSFNVPDGGMSVWVKFYDCNLKLVAERAAKMGVIMSNGLLYGRPSARFSFTGLGFAASNEKEMLEAIKILKKAITSPPHHQSSNKSR